MQPPRSAYFHVPFCRRRCGYCNFALVAGRDHWVDQFLDCLAEEIEKIPDSADVDTVYFGGGTPTYLSARQFDRLCDIVFARLQLSPGGEFTIEANPEDLPGELESTLIDRGVNRISLGVQSFDPLKLRSLERHHDTQQIQRSLDSARRVTKNVSLDLIFGAPHDSYAIWERDLDRAVESGAVHVSTYELTIEKGTLFWNRQLHRQLGAADEEVTFTMYQTAIERLAEAGFEQYEVSSHARPTFRSRHNQVYWQGQPYWAFGPGAASFVSGLRQTNHPSVSSYIKKIQRGESPVMSEERLDPIDIAIDRLVFGIRMIDGVDRQEFERQTGFRIEQIVTDELLDRLIESRLVSLDEARFMLTAKGLLFGDTVCAELLEGALQGRKAMKG